MDCINLAWLDLLLYKTLLQSVWLYTEGYCRSWCKIGKAPRVIKERLQVSTPLSDSWEALIPPQAGVTLGRFLHQLVLAFFSPTSIESIMYGMILH